MVPGHLAVVDPHGIPAHHAGVWGFLGVVIKVLLAGGMIVHGWYLIHSLLFPMTVKVSRPVGRVAGQAVGGNLDLLLLPSHQGQGRALFSWWLLQ